MKGDEKLVFVEAKTLIKDFAELRVSNKDFMKFFEDKFELYHKLQAEIRSAENLRASIIKKRNLEVVYICGTAGSGKTTSAKYFAEKKHFSYFITGGGEDILDSYSKEECIILDDFRGGTMKFSELLKFLDNNTNSSISSRYHNKDISNCRLIIITSVKKPIELYQAFSENDNKEPVEQLFRRLKHCFYLVDENGLICKYKIDKINYNGIKTDEIFGNMKDIYQELGIDTDSNDDDSIMNEFKQVDVPFEELPF